MKEIGNPFEKELISFLILKQRHGEDPVHFLAFRTMMDTILEKMSDDPEHHNFFAKMENAPEIESSAVKHPENPQMVILSSDQEASYKPNSVPFNSHQAIGFCEKVHTNPSSQELQRNLQLKSSLRSVIRYDEIIHTEIQRISYLQLEGPTDSKLYDDIEDVAKYQINIIRKLKEIREMI